MRNLKAIVSAAVVAILFAGTAYAQKKQNGYSVILLLGDAQGPSSLDGLPPAPGVRKALDEVVNFLPYKSYRVLDTQWMRSGMTRMKGAEDQEYEVTVNADEFMRMPGGGVLPYDPASGKPPVIGIRFLLQESGAPTIDGEEYARSMQAAQLDKQRITLRDQLAELRARYGAQHPAVVQQETRIKQLDAQIGQVRARKLMDARFEMSAGETVVVGTSKIGGGEKGLVVLLTSVLAGGK